ncbi:MAG: thioredoxin family protein [Flavobacteriaceae bacterium]|jgi:thiol-disulfide isomerase/thioredoxin|nr:thioredoxin family protein [Flavobacteriaceae bacterium]
MTNIDSKTLENSYTYVEFRSLVTNALANNPDSLNLADEYLPYAELNETRLKRLDKTLKLTDEVVSNLQQLQRKYLWVVITESWCGDAAQIVPVLNKMAEATDNIELKLVFRDQNLDLMDAFLTNGGRAIPKLIIADATTKNILGHWGPRPVLAQKVVTDYKAAHGVVDENGKTELQMWYTKDKGYEVQKEVIDLIASFE